MVRTAAFFPDLSNGPLGRVRKRLLHRHLDRIDRGWMRAFYQQVPAVRRPVNDTMLLVATTPEEQIARPGRTTFDTTFPSKGFRSGLQNACSRLVGAVVDGRVVVRIDPDVRARTFYAGTGLRGHAPLPADDARPRRLLLDALQRCGK